MTLLDTKKRRSKSGNIVVTKVYKGRGTPKTQHHHHYSKDCFPAGTRILTPSGPKAIEVLKLGDLIVSYEDGSISAQPVLKLQKFPSRSVVEIYLLGREAPIRTTRSHSFSTLRGWITAKDLGTSDYVHVIEHNIVQTAQVTSVESTLESCDVYSLMTAFSHTYIAEGVIAHNFTYFRALRTFVYRHLMDAGLVRDIARANRSQISNHLVLPTM